MAEVVVVPRLAKAAKSYTKHVAELASAGSTTEATYYPSVSSLLSAVLEAEELPFDVRINTSEEKTGGGVNLPDVALYDSDGQFLVVCGEVKLPSADIEELASSTERKNQIGRYLAQTRAVLITNIRSYGLLTVDPSWKGSGPVPPDARRIEQIVELWPSVAELQKRTPISPEALVLLAELIETAATRYAPIAEPESLARIMARQARHAKADLPPKFTHAVQGLLDDFGKALGVTFVGLDGEGFLRSSLIQTAFYGLFAGWALWWQGPKKKAFRWEDLAEYLKIPFLGSLFYEFRHPSRIKELKLAKHLDIATETLSRVDGERFFNRFRLPSLKGEDELATTAIMYFYEPFLEAFDPQLRKELGVWYTPTAIVRYQVAKIDRLLREELGCSRGFADEKVVVLDPACGTGAYLIEALRQSAAQLESEGAGATLAAKLLDSACRRFIGFEILTAPFVVAQLQLYLLLARMGAAPGENRRPAVFLTNALTGWHGKDQLKLNFPELQDEHDAAMGVKRDAKVIVVLGNPPYNRFAGVPLEEEADLVDHYKGIARNLEGKQVGQSALFAKWGVRKQLLDDLYIRFFRLAEVRIGEKAEYGVVCYISNGSFLNGRSHPMMRESLLQNFQAIWVDNLNGDKYRTGKVIPENVPGEGTADQSVFTTEHDPRGIQVGTAITTYLKRPEGQREKGKPTVVYYRDFWGRAAKKRDALIASLDMDGWTSVQRETAAAAPEGPREYEEITPVKKSGWKFSAAMDTGYETWPAFDDLFPKSFQGVNPNRGLDGSVVDTDRAALEKRMKDYFSELTFGELQRRYPALCEPRARFDPKTTRERLKKERSYDNGKIKPYVLFPLDARWLYYEREAKFLNEARSELGEHLEVNEFLVGVPQPRQVSESRPLILSELFDLHVHDWGSVGFPAQINSDGEIGGLFTPSPDELMPSANLNESVWTTLKSAWRLKGDLHGESAKRLCRELFRYSMAIAHSPQYELDHRESLAQDWPHVPIAKEKAHFDATVEMGEQLAQLLDPMRDVTAVLKRVLGNDAKMLAVVQRTDRASIQEIDLAVTYTFYGSAAGRWDERAPTETEAQRPEWGKTTGNLYLNEAVFLGHVPQEVWRYELGGYPVLKKWLGYRDRGRRNGVLSLAELDFLRGMVLRIAAVLALRPLLDTAYETASANAWLIDDFVDPHGTAAATTAAF